MNATIYYTTANNKKVRFAEIERISKTLFVGHICLFTPAANHSFLSFYEAINYFLTINLLDYGVNRSLNNISIEFKKIDREIEFID